MRFPTSQTAPLTLLERLRDPLLQVWLMAGMSVMLVVIGHLRAIHAIGEGKNAPNPTPLRLLAAGVAVSWSDEEAPTHRETRRPLLVLNTRPPVQRALAQAKPKAPLDLAPLMQDAATRPLAYVNRPLRESLTAAATVPAPLTVQINWSGASRGNAALICLQTPPSSGTAARFVIGNGSRSRDGQIIWITPGQSLASGLVQITLIGQSHTPTPAQSAALGELLNVLEALSGHPILPPAAAPGTVLPASPTFATGLLLSPTRQAPGKPGRPARLA
jgi:hypothetical protein